MSRIDTSGRPRPEDEPPASPPRRRPSGGLAVSAALLGSFAAFAQSTPPVPVTLPKLPPASGSNDGSFPVTLTLKGTRSGISAQAVQGAWVCSARAVTKATADAEVSKISALSGLAARAEFESFLEYRAHYLGQQATVAVSTAAGGAAGPAPITIVVKRDDLLDPATRRVINQPTTVIGCWLRLSNAAGQSGFAYQVPQPSAVSSGPGAVLQMTAPPYVLASAEIPNG